MRSRSTPTVGGLRLRRVLTAAIALILGAAVSVAAGGTASAGSRTARVGNPYIGAGVYVNPQWSAQAAAEPDGSLVADQPTFVWLDSIASIQGTDGRLGLRGHLDEALRQTAGHRDFVFQVVLHDLPGRECAHPSRQGELGPDELARYESEYVDPIAAILGEPKYASLRIVAVVEPGSLLDLATNTGSQVNATMQCNTMLQAGTYVSGIGYALAELGAVPNVYGYLDGGQHAALGYPDTGPFYVQLLRQAATASGSTVGDVEGFIANVGNYFVVQEPYFEISDLVNGVPVYQSKWVDFNAYADELPFVQDLRTQLVAAGFGSGIGALIDTSRDGWGGPDRPTGSAQKTDVNSYVDGSRTDRRLFVGNWCNQAGAGLGARPVAVPVPGVDAFVWAKPPGESDGAGQAPATDPSAPYDRMCDPAYAGVGDANHLDGALPGGPPYGEWFSGEFRQLVQNAYPPLTG